MLRISVVTVGLFGSIAGCSQHQWTGARGRTDDPDAAYVLHLLGGNPRAVSVTLTARGAAEGRTVFAVAEEWGGVRADDQAIIDARVVGPNEDALSVEHPNAHQWIVRHSPNEWLTFSYTLRQPPDRQPSEHANDYRPIITDRLFHVIGNHGLAAPEHLQNNKPQVIRLAWEGFEEAGWKVASSHGPGSEAVTVAMPLEEFRNALFLAGDIRLHQRDIRGRKLGVAVYGDWSFRDEEFVDLVERIVRMEREFFDDFSDPWYLVSIIPSGPSDPGSLSLGGTGLTNCFAFFASPNASLSAGPQGADQIKRVLAHEYFHRWNGGRIDFPDPEQAAYWFSEGFTDFYARRLLLHSGMITPAEYADSLNESIRNYYLSPARSAPNDRIVSDFWSDRHVGDLPYRRGDLVALLVDHHIREKSGGKRSLDDVMRELLAGHSGRLQLNNDALFSRFATEAGPQVAEHVRKCVIDGDDPPLPAKLHSPELTRASRQVGAFDLGFDLEASRAAKEIQSVRTDSAAHHAGLRDGQRLLGMSIHFGQPDREVVLTVEESGARRDIRYLPAGPAVEVPFFESSEMRD